MSSSLLTRWGLPIALIAGGLLLSAFVFFAKLPEAVRVLTPRTGLALAGTPVVALTVLVVLRLSARVTGPSDRSTDVVIVWLMTFLFGVHAAVLGTMIGMVSSLKAVVPHAVAIMLLGLGPAVALLSPNNPLGIRTASTLADAGLWRRTHRLAGWLLAASGALGLIGALVGGPWALVSGVAPAVIALIVALIYGSQPPMTQADEETRSPTRLQEESSIEATDA